MIQDVLDVNEENEDSWIHVEIDHKGFLEVRDTNEELEDDRRLN